MCHHHHHRSLCMFLLLPYFLMALCAIAKSWCKYSIRLEIAFSAHIHSQLDKKSCKVGHQICRYLRKYWSYFWSSWQFCFRNDMSYEIKIGIDSNLNPDITKVILLVSAQSLDIAKTCTIPAFFPSKWGWDVGHWISYYRPRIVHIFADFDSCTTSV